MLAKIFPTISLASGSTPIYSSSGRGIYDDDSRRVGIWVDPDGETPAAPVDLIDEAGTSLVDSRNVTPYFYLRFYDTPYTVKSHGPDAYFYAFPTYTITPQFSSDDMKWKSNVPFVKFDSGKSWPLELSPYVKDNQQFGIVYSGYINHQQSSLKLYFTGKGRARVEFGGDNSSVFNLDTVRSGVCSVSYSGLSPDGYTHCTIYYWSGSKHNDSSNVFCVNMEDSSFEFKTPLSAGYYYCESDYGSGIGSFNVPYVQSVLLSASQNESSKLEFKVPLVASSDSVGYKYVESGNYVESVADSDKKLKEFRMVEYYTGYQYGNGSIATVLRFVGQIKKIQTHRDEDNAYAIVECYDWKSFLSDSINEGYPDVSDYLAVDYIDGLNVSSVAGESKPRCYDSWSLRKALFSLLYNSGIDPKTLRQKSKQISVDEEIVDGNYAFFELIAQNPIKLDRQLNYGNPLTVVSNEADDKYVWQFGVGSKIVDNVQTLMDHFGIQWGFNSRGDFFAKSVKNPLLFKSIDDITFTGSWTEALNASSCYGVSQYSSTAADKAVATFVGRAAYIICDVDNASGTIHIKLSNPTLGMVATADYHLNNTDTWSYYDGVSDSLGYNPCKIYIGSGNYYGYYSLNITVKENKKVSLNAISVYDNDYDTSIATYYTGSYLSRLGNIIDHLDVETDANQLRNDVIVVGKANGVRTSLSLDTNEILPVNPNNPVSSHVVSRAIDRASIGSISNSNYTGRKIQTIIIDDNIITEDKANWLASQTILRYNELSKAREPNLVLLGNPLLEVGDKVQLCDIAKNTVATSQSFWVSSFSEEHNEDGEYKTDLSLNSFEPWASYFMYPTPSLKRFSNSVFTNGKVYNTGIPIVSGGSDCALLNPNSDSDNIVVDYHRKSTSPLATATTVREILPSCGYCKVGNEVIKYQSRSCGVLNTIDQDGSYVQEIQITLGDLTRGMFNTSENVDMSAYYYKAVELQTSPYITEEYGIAPAVQFDLLLPGFVRVLIYNDMGQLVDIISGNTAPDGPAGWEYLGPGTYTYTWGMLDRIGVHNETNFGAFQYSGSHALDLPYLDAGNLGNWTDHAGPYYDPFKIGTGFYAWNRQSKKYGKFIFSVQYMDPQGIYTKKTMTLDKGIQPIHSVLRPTGSGVNHYTDGIMEEFRFSSDSDYNSTGLATLWWSQSKGDYVKSNSSWTRCSEEKYRRFYTGDENGANGLAFDIKNLHNVKRIVSLSVERTMFVILNRHFSYMRSTKERQDTTHIELADVVTEDLSSDNDFTHIIDGSGTTFYAGRPKVTPFITPKASSIIHSWINEPRKVTLRSGIEYHKDINYYIGVSHLHLFKIEARDMSGKKHAFYRTIWWVPSEVLNTKDDYISGNVKQVYEGHDCESFVSDLLYGASKPDIVLYNDSQEDMPYVAITSNNSVFLSGTGVYGVVVYGKYMR